ncbi:hypothetical protein NLJ89_g7863 [Agrocybe chaxingu]|uniref:Tyr recombinase domain-containing protein n=1 Tax=Agrocybe chaxingu TaxID=84603 RepID=A0A9W8JTQ2_9AGAR|nr:hypothetical protein NLJ89_g7863 [Agrocybe chaxingu]
MADITLQRILDMMSFAWAPNTKETYGAGLYIFHHYCDCRVPPVPESERGPASEELLLEFLAGCAGTYSGSTLKNYFYGVKAWHTLHGLRWDVDDTRLTSALTAVDRLAPPSSRRPKREPFTTDVITRIGANLNLSLPLDAAVFACLTTTFWSASRLGEFTVPSVGSFDPSRHVKRSDVSVNDGAGRLNLPVTCFFLPWTKCAPRGETAYWSPQDGPTDPKAALHNHFQVNNPAPGDALFGWKRANGVVRPLTRTEFMRRVNAAASAAGIGPLQGHGIRIGSVLEYMLRGIPFDVVRAIGRWSSDAFTLYLRKHATILAPYIQNSPILEPFTRIAMPRTR